MIGLDLEHAREVRNSLFVLAGLGEQLGQLESYTDVILREPQGDPIPCDRFLLPS